jgi:hypothetical protein
LYKNEEFEVPRDKIVEEIKKQLAIYKDELSKGLVKYKKPEEGKDKDEKDGKDGKEKRERGKGKGKEAAEN